ncbi:hypothetical protein WN982_27330 [Paraburkholderia sp. IMGN_8]|uniref:hypothetical protein n=1 Tax=Paraburkholderia sp. IMGN_8 TaxID=3136564 RepID=UPI003100BE1E
MLMQAVVEGNLEAVLDEHFWLLNRTSSDPWPSRLKTLEASLALSGGRTVLHENGRRPKTGRIRCHVALPLHEAKIEEAKTGTDSGKKDDEAPVRPDLVRNAFNTPFWPMVLTTTSVGQEGLDFHLWCRAIGHWDPARGPVELEQREGRVDRYACLAVRRALSQKLGHKTAGNMESPWASMSDVAHELEDDEQMAPWWRLDGATTQQLYFSAAGSRELELRRRLEWGRAFYRMLLGMPDARALLDELQAGDALTEEAASRAALQLSAWKLAQKDLSLSKKKP